MLANILVHVDDSSNCVERIRIAARLAKAHGSHLTGLYVITHDFYQPRSSAVTHRENEHRGLFDEIVAETGVAGKWVCVDWSVIGVSMTEIVTHHAHYSDLVVVGQAGSSVKGRVPADLPERVVLGAGRPVLVIPYAGVFPTVGERVLVAWKAGRESVRAVNDALPLLKKARRINLLAIDSSEVYDDDGELLCANVCLHLERHGLRAEAERLKVADASVGDTLLNRACEGSFDLLVMGAYAHTPQRTLVLGSVASHLLKQMTVPVLMSH